MTVLNFLKSVPVIRTVLPLIMGIAISMLSAEVWECSDRRQIFCMLLILICVLILVLFQKLLFKPLYAWVKGVFAALGFLCLGFFSVSLYPSGQSLPEELERAYWLCKVEDFPHKRNKSFKVSLVTQGYYFNNDLLQQKQKILTYFEIDSMSAKFSPGDMILVLMQPMRPRQNGNPGEFDYRNYLYRNGIYYQAYINKDDWMIISRGSKEIHYVPKKIRHLFVTRINDIIGTGEEFGIITALAIGSKDFLDDDIRTSYSETGAMHVLAVSGLHVGLVWYVLDLLLGSLKRLPFTRLIYYTLMIFLLWMYVMITGMSASVTRAGVMLTIVIVSNLFSRGSVSYNPVFLSAFILLTINPYLLLDVGFQFSYMAVSGILFFQPRIKKLMTSKSRIINYIYELISVSIAAQAGTFIISIYYFNKFPIYFLLTNFVVIPLVTIILMLIILSAFLWFFEPAFNLLTRIESFFAGLMNMGVKRIELLPCSSVHDIYFDRVDVLFLFISFIFIQLFIVNKNLLNLKFTLISLSCFFTYGSIRDRHIRESSFTALYNIPGIFAFDIVDRNIHYLISSGLTKEKEDHITRNCSKFWLMRRTVKPVFIDLDDPDMSYEGLTILSAVDEKCKILVCQGKCIVVITDLKADKNYYTNKTLSPELILINTGGELKLPPYISLSGTEYMAVSSGFKGGLYTRDFKSEAEGVKYFDVRSGKAMVNEFSFIINN